MNKTEFNEYHRLYQKNRYRKLMNSVIQQLGGKCNKCGSIEKLEIDHINPEEKEYQIANLSSFSKDKLQTELLKCQLLCHKCHKEKHSAKNNHGTLGCARYCKCDLCRKAKSDYDKEYRKRANSLTGQAKFS